MGRILGKQSLRFSIIDEHLGRDAAVVQTGAAHGALIPQSDSPVLVSGLRSHMRSRARADDDKVEFVHGSSSRIEVVA